MSEYRITKNVFEKDVEEIFDNLKEYNLSKLEYSEIVPIGIFKEDKDGKKQAGLIGETFGNWLFIKYLWVSSELRGKEIGKQFIQYGILNYGIKEVTLMKKEIRSRFIYETRVITL